MNYLQFALGAVALTAAPHAAPKSHEKVAIECGATESSAPVCSVNVKPAPKRPDLFHGAKPVAKPVRL